MSKPAVVAVALLIAAFGSAEARDCPASRTTIKSEDGPSFVAAGYAEATIIVRNHPGGTDPRPAGSAILRGKLDGKLAFAVLPILPTGTAGGYYLQDTMPEVPARPDWRAGKRFVIGQEIDIVSSEPVTWRVTGCRK